MSKCGGGQRCGLFKRALNFEGNLGVNRFSRIGQVWIAKLYSHEQQNTVAAVSSVVLILWAHKSLWKAPFGRQPVRVKSKMDVLIAGNMLGTVGAAQCSPLNVYL